MEVPFMERKNFYAYLLIDSSTNQPFYAGKGTNRRMYEHYRVRNRLKNPLLKNKILQMVRDNVPITYDKVLINVNEQQAFQKEIELVNMYGRKIDRTGTLCNLTEGGEGSSISWTEEKKQAKSKAMKGSRGYLPIRSKPVSQYTLEGEHITDYTSAKVASDVVPGANRSYITQVCRGKRKSAGGFIWVYKGNPVPVYTKQYYRPVEQYSLTGKLLQTFQSLTHAQTTTGVELHNISEACRGNSKTAGGFIWKYA
jgi:hypothetical protein